jgi:hypothetical protein
LGGVVAQWPLEQPVVRHPEHDARARAAPQDRSRVVGPLQVRNQLSPRQLRQERLSRAPYFASLLEPQEARAGKIGAEYEGGGWRRGAI